MTNFDRKIGTFIALLVGAAMMFSCSAQSSSFMSEKGIAYELEGEGVLVVFIHGSNLDRRMWATQLDYFKNSAKVLAYDLRGLGSSEIPTQPYSDVEDLIQLLDELHESNPVIVGLSAGAQVALDFALSRPEKVRKLVLVSPSLNGYAPSATPPYLTDLIDAIRDQGYQRADEVLLGSELMSVPSEHTDLVREMVTSSRQWNLSYELIQQSSASVLANLNRINAQTLIMIGGSDIAAITELGNHLSNELPNARIIDIPEGRHLLNLSNPAEFNEAIAEFLEFSTR